MNFSTCCYSEKSGANTDQPQPSHPVTDPPLESKARSRIDAPEQNVADATSAISTGPALKGHAQLYATEVTQAPLQVPTHAPTPPLGPNFTPVPALASVTIPRALPPLLVLSPLLVSPKACSGSQGMMLTTLRLIPAVQSTCLA
jgi:hypothetical protein